MKKPTLVLLALLALLPCAQLLAQSPPAARTSANSAVPAPDAARFLATLAAGQAQAPNDLVPAPSFMSNCGYNPPCAAGQLCCFLCGNPPDDPNLCLSCVTPIKGRCPRVV